MRHFGYHGSRRIWRRSTPIFVQNPNSRQYERLPTQYVCRESHNAGDKFDPKNNDAKCQDVKAQTFLAGYIIYNENPTRRWT